MRQLTISARLHGSAPEASGDPPATDPSAQSISVEARAADAAPVAIADAAYTSHVVFTGPVTFAETGTIRYGDGEVDIVAAGEGTIGPAADSRYMHGAVVWSVIAGRGDLTGATGLITSNFVIDTTTGEHDDDQVAVLYLP